MILFRRPYQRSPPGRSTLLAIKRRYNLRKWLIRITEIREGTHDRSPILGPDQLTPYTINPNTGGHAANNLDVHVTNAGVEKLSIYGGGAGWLTLETFPHSWAQADEVAPLIVVGVAISASL